VSLAQELRKGLGEIGAAIEAEPVEPKKQNDSWEVTSEMDS